MCLGIPMKVVELSGNQGVAETGGVRRRVRLDLLQDVGVGEYVLIHAGYAIQKLSEQDARETLELIGEFISAGDPKANAPYAQHGAAEEQDDR